MIVSLAMKNAMRQPRRSLLLGGAVAFGVLIICLVSGFVSGMESAVQNNVTLVSGGHILISGYTAGTTGRAQNRSADGTLADAVRKALPEAISVSPAASAQATVVFGSREQQLKLRGVQWKEDSLFSGSLIFIQGDGDTAKADRSIVLGALSAERFGLSLGDSVLVRLSTASGQQNVTEYKLGAVYDDTAAGGMTTALVPFDNLRKDLNMPEGNFQTLSVFLPDASRADAAAALLKTSLAADGYTIANIGGTAVAAGGGGGMGGGGMGGGGMGGGGMGGGGMPGFMNLGEGKSMYRISTITELSGQMGAVLGTVRWIGIAVFVVMLALTAAGIANTYRMILVERTKEIGTLRCIGFRKTHVYKVFQMEALFISAAGALAGIALSFPAGGLISLIHFDTSGGLGSALTAGRLAFVPDPAQFALSFAAVLVMSLFAVSGPARRAAALQPAQALTKTA